ncbi:FtsJ-domain-containing protein [Ramicandelaber brevisporus]|nr:FtsJ-domain-containing protein [Ramicandelaber brevisporus]
MGFQKKTGKGRLDKYYKLAKEQGYRARSAFKLVQLNKKYNFLGSAKVLVDLCAAPGGWLQVAAKYMPVGNMIIGVDLAPIKPLPGVITFQEDITSDKCRRLIAEQVKDWKVDVFLHDGAPNVGSAWVQDAYSQAELVLMSLKLAVRFLRKGGTFVTKVFRSRDYNSLMYVFNTLFGKVEATKPPSSRNVSAEIFVVCRDYKAPKKIDDQLLDPTHVFGELENGTSAGASNMTDILFPEKKKRHREGYDDGDYILHKTVSIMDFINTQDPVKILSATNTLAFDTDEAKDLLKRSITTDDIKLACEDLKVLGKKDFKQLLKWRKTLREDLGLETAASSSKANADADGKNGQVDETEEDPDELLARLKKESSAQEKQKLKKLRERRINDLKRMQLHMITDNDMGLEQQQDGHDMFDSERMKKRGAKIDSISSARVDEIDVDAINNDDDDMINLGGSDSDIDINKIEDDDSDLEHADAIALALDDDYSNHTQRREQRSAKVRARKAYAENPEFTGFSDRESDGNDGESDDENASDSEKKKSKKKIQQKRSKRRDGERSKWSDEESASSESETDADSDSDDASDIEAMASNIAKQRKKQQQQNQPVIPAEASKFFSNDLFKGVLTNGNNNSNSNSSSSSKPAKAAKSNKRPASKFDSDSESDADDESGASDNEWSGKAVEKKEPLLRLDTPESISAAYNLVNRMTTKAELLDDGFNRYAFNDPSSSLPSWFMDDERKFNKPNKPITKEAVEILKAKLRVLDARPIKKIAEAKQRKKFKAAQRLVKLQKKTSAIAENEDLTEREKAQSISQLIAKQSSKKKPTEKEKVKVVVARGSNRGNKGRPQGVKGRYKMVDSRMKKEVRAEKRAAKKQGGRSAKRQRR